MVACPGGVEVRWGQWWGWEVVGEGGWKGVGGGWGGQMGIGGQVGVGGCGRGPWGWGGGGVRWGV